MRAAIAGVGEQDLDRGRPVLLLGLFVVGCIMADIVGVADGDIAFAGEDRLGLHPVAAGGLARQIGFHALQPFSVYSAP